MKYVGLQTQIDRNNRLSVLLLLLFPSIILGMVWVFLALADYFGTDYRDEYGEPVRQLDVATVNYYFMTSIPWVVAGVAIWFAIAYFFNASMVKRATGARPLTRNENPRIYNIVENLCMACGMDMPQINVVNDPMLNAFASGIDKRSYTVTVTTGLADRLDDDELAGVIAHELTHIRNKDTRLLITSIIFVGIVSTVMNLTTQMIYRTLLSGGSSRRNGKNNGLSIIVVMAVALICIAIAYFFTLLTRFAISRKREYMADAGGAELCGNPLALASALRKISENPGLKNVKRDDVAQLFIVHPKSVGQGIVSFLNSLFATHPDIARRIEILEQF